MAYSVLKGFRLPPCVKEATELLRGNRRPMSEAYESMSTRYETTFGRQSFSLVRSVTEFDGSPIGKPECARWWL